MTPDPFKGVVTVFLPNIAYNKINIKRNAT